MKENIKKMIRRRFGKWVFSHDRVTGFYIICNRYKGVTYVEANGFAGAGDVVLYPKGCRNPEYIFS